MWVRILCMYMKFTLHSFRGGGSWNGSMAGYLWALLYSRNTNISRDIIKHNIRTSMNERIHLFIKIYLSHFILEKVDVCCVWEMSWRQGQTAILTQILLTIAAFLSHLGLGLFNRGSLWAANPSVCKLTLTLASCIQLTRTAPDTWFYYFVTFTCFRCSSAYLHKCISWLTARSRVNI